MNEASAEGNEQAGSLDLVVEDFGRFHPGLNPDLLIEPTLVALARYHQSPADFRVSSHRGGFSASVRFGPPDPRSVNTIERERCIEEGAILFAAIRFAPEAQSLLEPWSVEQGR